jgi:REP element-mobilizing transposase RayT/transposase
MATKPRIAVPDQFYEISSIGNTNYNILGNDQLKQFFLDQLSLYLEKYGLLCVSWSLMINHYHLVIKTGSEPTVSIFMQTLNSVFAKKYNKINDSFGSVFAKRFSSIIVQEGNNLKEIIRHVHLNPVRSGDCTLENLDSYKWCGHNEIVNDKKADSIISKQDALNLFSESGQVDEYKAFVTTSCKEVPESVKLMQKASKGSNSVHKSNGFVIGDGDFTKKVFEQDLIRKVQLARYVRECMVIEDVQHKVDIGKQFTAESIRMHGRLNEVSTLRQLLALYAHCYYGFRCTEIAKYLNVSASAVSMMISRCYRIENLELIKEVIGC